MSSQDNDCSQPNCCSGISRRQFLHGALGVAATAAGWSIFGSSSPLEASPDHKLTDDEIKQWFAALKGAGRPLKYSSNTSPLAAVPMGGIGCGNVYIGSDGALKDWLIFNNVQPMQIPNTFFAVCTGKDQVTLLQTSKVDGVDDKHLVSDISLIGEYPYAKLAYKDSKLPVDITLEAVSPMIPLDSSASAYPAAIFTFKIKNPGTAAKDVTLMFAAQNSAALGNLGGNTNTALMVDGLTGLSMAVEPGTVARIESDLRIVSTARALKLTSSEKTPRLDYISTPSGSLRKEDIPANKSLQTVFWLDNPGNLDGDAAVALLNAVKAGSILVISNASALLNHYAAAKRQTTDKTSRPNILIDDFETGDYGNWTVQGEAFGKAPQTGTLPIQNAVSGWQGKFLVNSFVGQDNPTGKLTSRPFKIERTNINFLIGGGSDAGRTAINLLVDGKIVRTTTGKSDEHLDAASWEVSGLQGQTATIEIVDAASGPWGHINVDGLIQSDSSVRMIDSRAMAAVAELLPLEFEGIKVGTAGVSVSVDLPNLDQNIGLTRLDTAVAGKVVPLAQTLASTEDNTPVVLSMLCEAGKVVLVMGALMGLGASALAERRQALKLLAAAAGTKYAAGVGVQPTDPTFGDMAIATDAKDASVMLRFESAQQLVTILGKSRSLPSAQHNESTQASPEGEAVKGALSASVSLPPGGESTIRFYLTWRFPNYTYQGRNLGNHYAKRRDTAYAVASEVHKSRAELLSTTELYRKTMYETTLPYWLVDCLTSQSSTIRSEVCIWTDEDAFAGFEGAGGCCPMNCSHVWGYEQTLARLYPDLEQRMRHADLKHQQNPDGGLNNRIILPLQPQPSGERPFLDGHASGILKAYREHLNSPDNSFLKNYYPNIKQAVEYLVKLDGEKPDGVIEGEQWNTYDCQVSGANSFIGAYYLAALRAGKEMATLMGDAASAKRWRSSFLSGRKKLVDLCWNGEYFAQNLPVYENMATQYGPGCLADQLIGQWWAHQLGLGYVLPPELVKKALQSVFNFNWLTDFTDFKHNQRVFADGHDKGLLCCTWPNGGRPPQPILYCDEVWTGIEYQVAAHMIYEGMEREGLAIVAGARERYDGQKRNPWNEIECGGHYARAMSNWSLLLAVSGFQYDGPKGILGFAPTFSPEKFKAPFTTAEGWGSYAQVIEGDSLVANLFLAHGTLALNELRVAIPRGKRIKSGSASVSGKAVGNVSGQGAFAVLSAKSLSLLEGQTLSVQLQLG